MKEKRAKKDIYQRREKNRRRKKENEKGVSPMTAGRAIILTVFMKTMINHMRRTAVQES